DTERGSEKNGGDAVKHRFRVQNSMVSPESAVEGTDDTDCTDDKYERRSDERLSNAAFPGTGLCFKPNTEAIHPVLEPPSLTQHGTECDACDDDDDPVGFKRHADAEDDDRDCNALEDGCFHLFADIAPEQSGETADGNCQHVDDRSKE